jgi:threonine aldolase
MFTPDELDAAVQPPAYWSPRTSLVAVENTHNRAGGRVWPLARARAVAERARERGLAAHLDGARVWNASAATGLDVHDLCAPFDTVSVCFSKGLGAPVGSAFCGPRRLVEDARRFRKRWGGGMRQSGVLAAAALHALAHHRGRLPVDHDNARAFATALAGAPGIHVDVGSVETNIVNVDIEALAEAAVTEARSRGLAINASGPRRLRAVTHLDVTRADVLQAAAILRSAVAHVLGP